MDLDLKVKAFREHKHNYARLFRTVVSEPARAIMEEYLNHPEYFSPSEREQILRIYTDAIELRGAYNMLGKLYEEQVSEKEVSMIPQIENLAQFFKSIYATRRDTVPITPRFNKKLLESYLSSTRFCQLLHTMEVPGYGTASGFYLRKVVDEEFKKDLDKDGFKYKYESFCGDLSTVKINMNEEGFKIHVLSNIIENFHKYAFADAYIESKGRKTEDNDTLTLGNLSIFYYIYKSFLSRMKDIVLPSHQSKEPSPLLEISTPKDNAVRMELKLDPSDSKRVNLFIMNNGESFDGDPESVFSGKKTAKGSGIGLSSARNFLQEFGATIKMVTNPNEDYKVCFIINAPIYEF